MLVLLLFLYHGSQWQPLEPYGNFYHARKLGETHTQQFIRLWADQAPTLGPWLEEICLSSHFVVSLASSIFLVSSKYLLTNC